MSESICGDRSVQGIRMTEHYGREPMSDDVGIIIKARKIHGVFRVTKNGKTALPVRGVPIVLIGGPSYAVCSKAIREDNFLVVNDRPINHPTRDNQTRFRARLRTVLQKR